MAEKQQLEGRVLQPKLGFFDRFKRSVTRSRCFGVNTRNFLACSRIGSGYLSLL